MATTFAYRNLLGLLSAAPPGVHFAHLRLLLMQSLLDTHGIRRDGVIHLGGHEGEEVFMYAWLGFRRAVMVEPLDEAFAVLTRRCTELTSYLRAQHEFLGPESRKAIEFQCVKCAVSARSGVSQFYKTKEPYLSSLAKPRDTSAGTPFESERIDLVTRTLDDIVETLCDGWTLDDFSYLRMNIQGGELLALEGAERTLRRLQAVLLEVNLSPRYEGQPYKEDFDVFLGSRGFECSFGYSSGRFGNLLYCRR